MKKKLAEYIINLIVNFVYMLYFYICCYHTYVLIKIFFYYKQNCFLYNFFSVYIVDTHQRELIFGWYLIKFKNYVQERMTK